MFRSVFRFYGSSLLTRIQQIRTECKSTAAFENNREELSKILKERNLKSIELGTILLTLKSVSKKYTDHPDLWESIKIQYKSSKTRYDAETLSILIWVLKIISCEDRHFAGSVIKELPRHIPKFKTKHIVMSMEGLAMYSEFATQELIHLLGNRIIELEGSFPSSDIPRIAKHLRLLSESLDWDLYVYDVIERETLRNKNQLNLRQLGSILSMLSKVVYKRPSDFFTIIQNTIIEKIPTINHPSVVPIILNCYSQMKNVISFSKIYNLFESHILENPLMYLQNINDMVMIIHSYSKFDYKRIMELCPKYLPELPQELISKKNTLGVYLYSVIRSPPNPEYEAKAIRWIFEHRESISSLHQKKILVTMLETKNDNKEFWENFHKLDLKFQPSDSSYIIKVLPQLKALNLIQ